MTDEELLLWLRLEDTNLTDFAADRIETLTKEREQWRRAAETRAEGWKISDDARIEAEAKLTKVVEALQWCSGSADFNEGGVARVEQFERTEALTEQLAAARQDAKEAEAYAEELERELNTCRMAQAVMDNTVADLEAKLAKALEALENVIGEYDLFRKDEYERGLAPLDDEIYETRAILAEIKSGVATTPYGLEGESHDPL